MKLGLIIAGVVAGLIALTCLLFAGERALAVNDTAEAIEVINKGLDWDNQTPISVEQQAERLDANVSVLSSQKSQRNGYLYGSAAAVALTAFCVFMAKKKSTTPEQPH